MLENTEGWSPYETYFKILSSDSANKRTWTSKCSAILKLKTGKHSKNMK